MRVFLVLPVVNIGLLPIIARIIAYRGFLSAERSNNVFFSVEILKFRVRSFVPLIVPGHDANLYAVVASF